MRNFPKSDSQFYATCSNCRRYAYTEGFSGEYGDRSYLCSFCIKQQMRESPTWKKLKTIKLRKRRSGIIGVLDYLAGGKSER